MSTRKRLVGALAPLALAAGGLFAAGTVAHAYGPIPGTIIPVSGCATTQQGGTCPFVFKVLTSTGAADPGCQVTFAVNPAGIGSIAPPSAVSGADGTVTTTFTAGTGVTGDAVISASCPNHGSAGQETDVITAGVPNTGGPPGGGGGGIPGSGGLPNTSSSAPGPSPVLFLGLGLALMIIVGGAVTLRRSSDTAS